MINFLALIISPINKMIAGRRRKSKRRSRHSNAHVEQRMSQATPGSFAAMFASAGGRRRKSRKSAKGSRRRSRKSRK
jgi:hypothetical protein